jgi:hypothetical protein
MQFLGLKVVLGFHKNWLDKGGYFQKLQGKSSIQVIKISNQLKSKSQGKGRLAKTIKAKKQHNPRQSKIIQDYPRHFKTSHNKQRQPNTSQDKQTQQAKTAKAR